MGEMIDVTCACGFRAEHLCVGVGMMAIEEIPVSRPTCGEVRTISVGIGMLTARSTPDQSTTSEAPRTGARCAASG